MKKPFKILAFLALLQSAGAAPENFVFICIDDLRPELGCYGVDYIRSPNIDALAKRGRIFSRHYVQAPTCGASRYALLTGKYGPADNDALFLRSMGLDERRSAAAPTLPAWLRSNGFETVSVGKVSHHPGGRGGDDWDDDTKPETPFSWDRHLMPCGPWQHPRGAMHGLANGEIRKNTGKMDVLQSFDGPDSSYPDGLITETALEEMDRLAKGDKPFFLAVGIIRPHLPFGAPAKYMEHYLDTELPPIPHPEKPEGKTTWHGSGEFMKYDRFGKDPRNDPGFATEVRKHYAACVSYADAQVGKILARIESLGLADDTAVILWGDHGWHLGEHSVWGKHTLFEESLRSPLIVSVPGMDSAGTTTNAVVETIDLFPTICDLANLEKPGSLQGSSLIPQISDSSAPGRVAISYRSGASTIRTATHRLIAHQGGAVELYDHTGPAGETGNIAASDPELVAELEAKLAERLGKQ